MYLSVFFVLVTSLCSVSPCPAECECSYPHSEDTVFCIPHRVTLVRVPELQQLPAGTTSLVVTGQNIERIYREDFTGEKAARLEVLRLVQNNIRVIDDGAFEELGDLSYLFLEENLITAINESTFSNLRNLKHLFLHENNINIIADGAFEELGSLTRLQLQSNSISVINALTFSGLQNLEILYMENNNIEAIDAAAFNELQNLVLSYLSNNSISVIPKVPRNVYSFNLNSNPLSCDCMSQWLIDFFADGGGNIHGICHSPDMMKGTSLGDLSDEDFTSCQLNTTDTPSVTRELLSTTKNPSSSVSPVEHSPLITLLSATIACCLAETAIVPSFYG